MIEAILEYNFLQNALYSALMASVVCGIIGTIIIEKNLVMMSGGIAHTSFGGVGLGYYLNIEPIFGALFFALFSSIIIVTIRRKTEVHSDTLIGIMWAMGMAVGILFISFMQGYPPDMSSYLFGDILTVTNMDINIMLILVVIVVFAITSLFNQWKSYLFDEEFSYVRGLNTNFYEYFLFILIALTVIVLIRVTGIILIIALLTAPPAIARLFTYDFKKTIFLAIIFGAFFSLSGLWLSYLFNIPSGSTIILLIGITYFILAFLTGKIKCSQ
ncbi:MAG: metal ABC transporter permease [Halanaerobiales bacterium]|nr:metal ABC transporter permease [Halanaerobiales bacterium]